MKKTMTKIFALVLVCAMLIGFVAMIPAYAAEIDTVQIVGHNVYFDDYLQIMYALDIPAGQTVDKIVLSDGTNEYAAVPYVDAEGNQINASIDNVEYPAYVADTGVSLQNIDAVVTASVYVDGAVAVTDEYSVLEYLHKRLVADDASEVKDAMYLSLLDTAEKMQVVLNDEVTLHKTSYVHVTNGTIDGVNADGMVAVGKALSGLKCDLIPGENQEIVWTVTEYTDAGVAGVSKELSEADAQELVVAEGVNLKLEAALQDIGADEPDVIANGNFIIAVDRGEDGYFAMDAELNDKNRINGVAVNVYNDAVTTDGAPEWTVTNVTGGVTLHNGSQYLAQKTANEAYFALSDEPVVWTVELGENGEIYLNSTVANDSDRGILFNANNALNQFGVYATTNGSSSAYSRAMLFMAYEACEHTGKLVNAKEATCNEEGYTGDTVCSICGALMAVGETIEATGEHNYVDGACSVCGTADPDAGTAVKKFVKVTSTADLTAGAKYLIVYEGGSVAFDGSRTTLDAVSNTVAVSISGDEIAYTSALEGSAFTITAEGSESYYVQSASGYYIGQTSNANGLKTSTSTTYTNTITFNTDGTINFVSGGAYLRYNATSGQYRFRYYKSSSYTGQKAICVYKLVEE